MRILGIETSCDETAASVIDISKNNTITLLSNVVASSLDLHAKTGGIIPEDAARNQISHIIPVISQALEMARIHFNPSKMRSIDIDAIAVTYGPGLIGSLLVGVETAKTLSFTWNIPIIPINHLFGHIYANWIEEQSDYRKDATTDTSQSAISFPAIGLIVSGGHTDLILMQSHKKTTWLGGTRDDAAGEAFDKCARLLGYNYPGGPKVAKLAEKGNPKVFSLPRPMIGSHDFDFSFSGLKTAFANATKDNFSVLRTSTEKVGWSQIIFEQVEESQKQILYDLCSSLQESITDVLVKKTIAAAEKFQARSIILGGGVSANQVLRDKFRKELSVKHIVSNPKLFFPSKSLCVDNAAMIAATAIFKGIETPWEKVTADPELYFD